MGAPRLHQLLALALALAAAPGPAPAQELGRLFLTPQQREELDRRRNSNVTEAVTSIDSELTVNGRVTRSGGRTTTWVNGVPQYDAYRGSAADRVTIEADKSSYRVKVGATLDRQNGEVRDVVDQGAVRVGRGGAK